VKHTVILGLALALMSAPLLGAADEKEDTRKMEGTWVAAAAELGGQKLSEEVVKAIKLMLKDGKYTVQVRNEGTDQGTYQLHPAKKPKAIDITGTLGPNKGKTFLAIYELSDDALKVCYDLSGKTRPSEFATKEGTQLFLVTYKREKP
jgi:uncharacterized protein (TIGR03067 family)